MPSGGCQIPESSKKEALTRNRPREGNGSSHIPSLFRWWNSVNSEAVRRTKTAPRRQSAKGPVARLTGSS